MAKKAGPFTVLGRFNSTRNPENIYVVKKHNDVDKNDSKHISCSCPGWRFSPKKNDGDYTCRHVEYVLEHGEGTIKPTKYLNSAIVRATVRANRKGLTDDPKTILARACQSASIHLGDHAFRQLLKALRPYLSGQAATTSSTTTDASNVLRVITLD
jgi:hypothetical protein